MQIKIESTESDKVHEALGITEERENELAEASAGILGKMIYAKDYHKPDAIVEISVNCQTTEEFCYISMIVWDKFAEHRLAKQSELKRDLSSFLK